MQAAIYCRISDDQTGERAGVTRQLEDCTAVAEAAGWKVHEVYTDNDLSATSGRPRPEYRRMLSAIEAAEIGAIIAWHPDRLYRVPADLEDLIKIAERHSIAIRTVTAGEYDLATPSGRMVARILGAVAKQEGEHKAERWRRSFRQRREAGEVVRHGSRVFGYTHDGRPIEAEAERLRQMAADVLTGQSLHSIVRALNDEGVPTARGGAWSTTGLRTLLRNPRLAGHSTIAGEVVSRGQWEPILDEQTWETVAALLRARSRHTGGTRQALLPGLVLCGVDGCGKPLQAGNRGHGERTYRCLSRAPFNGCGGIDVTAARVEEVVESYARRVLSDPAIRRGIAERRAGGQSHLLAEIDALESRLAEINEQVAEPGKSVGALMRAADKVRERIEDLQGRLSTSIPVVIPTDDAWPADLSRRRRLIELVVARVWVDPAPAKGGRFRPERVRIDDA